MHPIKRIGFFDSGLGGLTVLKPFLDSLEQVELLYFGDLAHLPFGNKSPEMIRAYLEEGLDFLAQFHPDVLIVACHSASTQIQETQWKGIPLFEVLRPLAEEALSLSPGGEIGVISTRATAESGVFQSYIAQLNSSAHVTVQACPLFVPLIEEGWIDDPITRLVVYRYLTPFRMSSCDTLILGCTHYPVIASTIEQALLPKKCPLVHAGPVLLKRLAKAFPLPIQKSSNGNLSAQLWPQRLKIFVSQNPGSTWLALAQTILKTPHPPDIRCISGSV